MIGTFSQYAVIHQNSAIKVDDDFPLDLGALVGCGVPTGWGSAVNVAKTGPGDTVVIYGIGGVGINAVQGAALSGAARIIAVDPLQNKREAALRFGATHAVATYEEARTIALDVTRGRGAHKAIITVGELDSGVVKAGFDVITKGGTLVITGIGNWGETSIQLPGTELAMWKKTIKGTVFGDCNPTADIPVLLDLFKNGQLKLEELVTKRYTIDQLNEAYEDLTSGQNIRGLLVHEH
jgi:S-(hydroxymethyl)glutathione dehydrogenase/alcohol dehydrogenase